MKRSDVEDGARIFRSRIVDSFKKVNEEAKLKSRFVAKNYDDEEACTIPTKAPTVQRMSQRVTLSSAATHNKSHRSYLHDITQAYSQANKQPQSKIYIEAPEEMNLEPDEVLLVLGPLYGIPESGLDWFLTYQPHHLNQLEMKASKVDQCLLYKIKGNKLEGMAAIQIDDTFGYGNAQFLEVENKHAKEFKSKPQHIIEKGNSVVFNGSQISFNEDGSYSMKNSDKLGNLQKVKTSEEFIRTRAAVQ